MYSIVELLPKGEIVAVGIEPINPPVLLVLPVLNRPLMVTVPNPAPALVSWVVPANTVPVVAIVNVLVASAKLLPNVKVPFIVISFAVETPVDVLLIVKLLKLSAEPPDNDCAPVPFIFIVLPVTTIAPPLNVAVLE